MPPLLREAGAPAAAPMARATSAFPTGGFIGRAMSQSREAVQPVCAKGSGARSRGAAGPVNADRGRVEEREWRKQTLPNPKPIEEGARGLGSSTPRIPRRPLAFPRTAQSCANKRLALKPSFPMHAHIHAREPPPERSCIVFSATDTPVRKREKAEGDRHDKFPKFQRRVFWRRNGKDSWRGAGGRRS